MLQNSKKKMRTSARCFWDTAHQWQHITRRRPIYSTLSSAGNARHNAGCRYGSKQPKLDVLYAAQQNETKFWTINAISRSPNSEEYIDIYAYPKHNTLWQIGNPLPGSIMYQYVSSCRTNRNETTSAILVFVGSSFSDKNDFDWQQNYEINRNIQNNNITGSLVHRPILTKSKILTIRFLV
jgi:hypothetical protein